MKDPILKLDTTGNFTMQGNGKVIISSTIELIGTNTELPVEIVADFSKVPTSLHSEYYQTLAYQYNKDLKVYSNINKETVKSNIVKPWYKRLFN
jgi:hypothetical protein